MPRWGGLLWQRNFRLLWIGETVSAAGTAMAAFIVPLLAVAVLRASTFAVTALTAAAYLPWLIIGLPAGAWADRLPTRALMICCDVVAAMLYASLPVAAWCGVLTVGQLLTVALLAGAADVVFATAYQVYLPALVGTADLIEGNAKLQGSASVATIAGRSTAGLAAEALGTATAVLLNAASFLISAGCLLAIRVKTTTIRPARPVADTTIREDIAQGIRYITRDPHLRPLTLYAAAANLAYGGYASLTVIFLVKTTALGPAMAAVLMSTGTAGSLAGALTARRLARRYGTGPVTILAALITGPSGLLIPLTRPGPWIICYAAGAALLGAGLLAWNILLAAFRQAYCPPELLGRAVAGMRFLSVSTTPLGALLAGALGTTFGVRTALWIMLAINALGTMFMLAVPRQDFDHAPASRTPRQAHATRTSGPPSETERQTG